MVLKAVLSLASRCFEFMLIVVLAALFFLVLAAVLLAVKVRRQRWHSTNKTVGFFHPYCLGGGGGERVLWAALKSLAERFPNLKYIIYTGDDPKKCLDFRAHVVERFNIVISEKINVEFIHLSSRTLLEARHYPTLTMIGQSLGSAIVGLEAMWKLCPDVYVDTTGHAFTLPLFRLIGGSRTAAYVHYPTISTDMLSRVRTRTTSHNNAGMVSRSVILTWLKVVYYNIFAVLYGMAGRCCQLTLVNSTWTANHIRQIWACPVAIVYPPCNVIKFLAVPLHPDDTKSEFSIVSIGQFRPEKDHALQIEILAGFLKECPDRVQRPVRLHFVGSCRNVDDEERVGALRRQADRLQVSGSVVFHLNAPFSELLKVCEDGTVGIHTMWNEHFGIGVVECMAAGLITCAHDSGGPKADIVVAWNGGQTGYLSSDLPSYIDALKRIAQLDDHQRSEMRERARGSVSRFTDEVFDKKFGGLLGDMLRSLGQ